MKPIKTLRARAMDLLSRREYSRLELRHKLIPYAQTTEEINEIDTILDEFAQQNWQSDERYAEMLINSKCSKHGSLRLRQTLITKGVDDNLIANYLPNGEQELASAQQVLQKKFKQPATNFTEKQKQIRFLLYRGFSIEIAQKALKWEIDEY